MNENRSNLCRVPVSATYQIIDGRPVMIDAEYAEIPAETILDFLLTKSRMGAQLSRCNAEGAAE